MEFEFKNDNITRFYEFGDLFEQAKAELTRGKKQTHWMWYFFPQLRGLGSSFNSTYYGLKGFEEAREFFNDRLLRKRLLTLTKLLLKTYVVFSYIDYRKLRSCMTLFYKVTHKRIFKKVIDSYFDGELDRRTLTWNLEQNKL